MKAIFETDFPVNAMCVDCTGRLKASSILFIAQEVAGQHCQDLALDYETLLQRRLFWAVSRHKVQITRLPMLGETLHIETWPMPTSRVAFPRSMVAYDEQGNECFRSISLWVLMDVDTRNMILPGKSGISVVGTVRGGELSSPTGLIARPLGDNQSRRVCFTDIDRNGHMNNTRYLDWIYDLLPSAFHRGRMLKSCTACYLSEAREGDALLLSWEILEDGSLQVDAHREEDGASHRVFTAKLEFA